jgi:hypothetical protein
MGINLIGSGLAPGADLPRSHFGPRWVQELDASPRRRGGTRQGLGSRDDLAGDLGTPVGEVIGHFKGNRHKLEPTDFTHQCGKGGHEAARLPRKDPLEGFALPLVGTRIDVEAERQLRLPRPDVAIKLPDSEDIEAVKPDVPVFTFADVIGEQAVAVIVGWWLCELARTRDVAASHVEPITLHPPLRNVHHGWTPFFQEHFSASCSPRPIGRCETESHEHTATVYGILFQPRTAPLISRSAWRTAGNLLWHESDHRAPPPLNRLAESLMLGVRRGEQPERRRSGGWKPSPARRS